MRRIVLVLAIGTTALATLATQASAGIGHDLPTIVIQRDGNELLSYEVMGLMATKGIVQAQVSDRFALELSASIRDGTSVVRATVPSSLPLIGGKDTSLKQGSEVPLTGIGQGLAEPRPDPVIELLDQGKSLTLDVSVSLVLETGSGATHVLDTIRATAVVNPA
ncbi:MAG: hypothetical protein HW413_127 [Thermoleophilia bacterium]|nr:hypothetical protein [Thermoleophilia bacterium]